MEGDLGAASRESGGSRKNDEMKKSGNLILEVGVLQVSAAAPAFMAVNESRE
jgi:hypothetical protein